MTPDDHVHHALQQYPALEETLRLAARPVRAAALHAISLAVREAQHAERRECARIALEELQASSTPEGQSLTEAIATRILDRDATVEKRAT